MTRQLLKRKRNEMEGDLQPKYGEPIAATGRRSAAVDDRVASLVSVDGRRWTQVEGDGDQVRCDLDVRFGHLTPRVMAGVSLVRVREIGEVARRERRSDGGHRQREEADGKKFRQARSMSEADHDAAAVTRIRPLPAVASFWSRRGL